MLVLKVVGGIVLINVLVLISFFVELGFLFFFSDFIIRVSYSILRLIMIYFFFELFIRVWYVKEDSDFKFYSVLDSVLFVFNK